jgi:hypothetical protein
LGQLLPLWGKFGASLGQVFAPPKHLYLKAFQPFWGKKAIFFLYLYTFFILKIFFNLIKYALLPQNPRNPHKKEGSQSFQILPQACPLGQKFAPKIKNHSLRPVNHGKFLKNRISISAQTTHCFFNVAKHAKRRSRPSLPPRGRWHFCFAKMTDEA